MKEEKNIWKKALEEQEKENKTIPYSPLFMMQQYSIEACTQASNKLNLASEEITSKLEEFNQELETLKHLNEWYEAELNDMLGRKLKILEKIDKKIKFNFYMLLSKVFDNCIKALKDEEDEEE